MRPTINQMAEALRAASDVNLNTLLNVVLGTCVRRGFLDISAARIVMDRVNRTVYETDPEKALQEAERLLRELEDLKGSSSS